MRLSTNIYFNELNTRTPSQRSATKCVSLSNLCYLRCYRNVIFVHKWSLGLLCFFLSWSRVRFLFGWRVPWSRKFSKFKERERERERESWFVIRNHKLYVLIKVLLMGPLSVCSYLLWPWNDAFGALGRWWYPPGLPVSASPCSWRCSRPQNETDTRRQFLTAQTSAENSFQRSSVDDRTCRMFQLVDVLSGMTSLRTKDIWQMATTPSCAFFSASPLTSYVTDGLDGCECVVASTRPLMFGRYFVASGF